MQKQHSIKVPQLYKITSNIYKKVKDEGASLKNLVYDANHPNKKAIYALVLTTIQRDTQIDFLMKKAQFLTKEPGIQVPLAKVLIAELLWGKKRLASECRPVKTVLAYEQIFQAHSSDIKDGFQEPLIQKVCKPRFVRVNTLKLAVNEAVDAFRDEGWILRRYMGDNYQEFLEQVNNLSESEFMVDLHVDDLLIFPPRTQFYKHVAYKCGEIILQDKASCLPVTLLNPPPGALVLDMCAAPGMKTTQLAALVQNSGKVFAVEKDAKRMETLRAMVESSGATCVETVFKDVLTVDGTVLPDVEYILVDPSCSGSGITDRFEIENVSTPADRINKLSGFQIMALKHAMRAFPKVKRIVYSTCSILPEENEAVVQDVIRCNSNFKLVNAKELLKSWDNFGSDAYEVGKYCIYSRPEYDLTNGFFVAVFERLQDGESNEFLKKDVNSEDIKQSKKKKKSQINQNNNYEHDQSIELCDSEKTTDILHNEEQDCDNSIKKSKKKKKMKSDTDVDQTQCNIENVEQDLDKKTKKEEKETNRN
ncbi:28S rRNA (cytosine-C(5))-methyltransferase [Atheta coriaria]|uniref:28S rRNA (cytosine-C(5))-methyltransferase n=1 Tax=Dalotia coriaria TaxID=877792 RepID=UPI0031F3869C